MMLFFQVWENLFSLFKKTKGIAGAMRPGTRRLGFRRFRNFLNCQKFRAFK
jgi:hypothetical protein